MMKMTILAPRRQGMTHDQFRTYLIDVHGPLVRSITEVAAEIRHYHYNFPLPGATDTSFGHPRADLDVITQGFFDSREAQLANMRHQRFKEVLRPDESNFADTSRALMHYTDEHEVVGGESTSTKVFYLRRRKPGLTREEFQSQWLAEFPRLLPSLPLNDIITRYVQNHVQAEDHHPDGVSDRFYDIIDEFWLSTPTALDTISPGIGASAVAGLEAELLDVGRTRAHIATMYPSIP